MISELPLTDAVKDELLLALQTEAEKMLVIPYSRESYNRLFPRGHIQTPIGMVKLGDHQFERLGEKDMGKRAWLLGALYRADCARKNKLSPK